LKKLKVDVMEDFVLKFTFRTKEDNFNELYKVKDKLKSVPISGIKGISQVLPVRRGDEFVIVTAGSNLKDIMKKEYTDTTRTTSQRYRGDIAVLRNRGSKAGNNKRGIQGNEQPGP
jgi:DNA-directed RNA polymerase beta' subunit